VGDSTTRVLLDCGLPLKHLTDRLAIKGLTTASIDAVFITHEHSDHIGSARQLIAQTQIPLWMSRGTYHALGQPDALPSLQFARDGVPISVGSLTLHPFSVPHDAKEPLQVVVASGAHKLGLLTDLGHVSPYVLSQIVALDALILECNHDPDLLANSRYPPFLKTRVGGDYGHLSNQQAAACLMHIAHPNLRHVIAGHLSEQNNTEDAVRGSMTEALAAWGSTLNLTLADAESGFDWIELD
jgi:phosphoribosyl 1,2-cyclic phosphodiesterase